MHLQQQQTILQDFPIFELSYEKIIHNKVPSADIFMAIPFGTKCFIWFTTYNDINICYLIELDYKTKQFKSMKQIYTPFSNSLILGTIFYGTFFLYDKIQCICIEDIYYYKSKPLIKYSFLQKLELLKQILDTEVNPCISSTEYTIFGLPFMASNLETTQNIIPSLPYKIASIKLRFFDSKNNRNIFIIKQNIYNISSSTSIFPSTNTFPSSNTTIDNKVGHSKPLNNYRDFYIKPDIEPDIYYLYNNLTDSDYIDLAYIPDFKTSKFMNSLFRNIKENDNLDTLEESDSESEFENTDIDKFVYLDRTIKMNCCYNNKFKKWCPISICN